MNKDGNSSSKSPVEDQNPAGLHHSVHQYSPSKIAYIIPESLPSVHSFLKDFIETFLYEIHLFVKVGVFVSITKTHTILFSKGSMYWGEVR